MPGVPHRYVDTFEKLKQVARELQQMIEGGEFYALTRAARRRKLRTVKRLYNRLAGPVAPRLLAGAVAAGVLFLAGCFQPTAQHFDQDPDSDADPDPDPDPQAPVEAFVPNFSAAAVANQYGMGLLSYYAYAILQPVFADMDGDGDLDLIYPTGSFYGYSQHLVQYRNDDPVSFDAPTTVGLPASGFYYSLALRGMVDIDGDGDLDAVMSGYFESSFGALVSYTDDIYSYFQIPVDTPFAALGGNYAADIAFADVDADGDQDMLYLGSPGRSSYSLYFSRNNGSAQEPVFLAPMSSPYTDSYLKDYDFQSVEAADLDGDGDIDVIVGAYFDDGSTKGPRILFYENKSTPGAVKFVRATDSFGLIFPGTYDWAYTHAYGGGLGIAAADLDGDGDMDLVVGPYNAYLGDYYGFDSIFLFFENTGSVVQIP